METVISSEDLLSFLDNNGLPYLKVDHLPVYTCDDIREVCLDLPGHPTKSLFLKSKKGRYYLLLLSAETKPDLKYLAHFFNEGRLSFASEEALQKILGVAKGAVTPLSLINDKDNIVTLIIEDRIWDGKPIHCHPLANTSTLSIDKEVVKKFLELIGHDYYTVEIKT